MTCCGSFTVALPEFSSISSPTRSSQQELGGCQRGHENRECRDQNKTTLAEGHKTQGVVR